MLIVSSWSSGMQRVEMCIDEWYHFIVDFREAAAGHVREPQELRVFELSMSLFMWSREYGQAKRIASPEHIPQHDVPVCRRAEELSTVPRPAGEDTATHA